MDKSGYATLRQRRHDIMTDVHDPPALPPAAGSPAAPDSSTGGSVNLIDPKLKDRALKRIQGLVRGNGVRVEDVVLETCDAYVYPFGARTFVKLAPVYGIKTEPGQNRKAQLAVSLEDFNLKIKSAVELVRSQLARRKLVIDFLFSRPDKGFGVSDQKIKFEALSEDFVMHEGCRTCSRNGQVKCQACTGRGMVPCPLCQTRAQIVCPQCRGTGRTPGSTKPHSCTRCRGIGKIQCPQCAGHNQVKCPKCAARGSLQCQKCAGTGWLSNLAHVEIEAQLHFDFDQRVLPPELARLITAFGARLAEKGDLEVRLFPEQPTNEEDLKRRREPPDMIVIDYAAKIPFGPVQFRLKERAVPATLFGYQGRLIETPSFLDDLTRKGQQALSEAAAGKGNVGEKVRRAARYRLLRDVILQAALATPQKRAIENLTARYPSGIAADRLLILLTNAVTALKIITRKPRTHGLAWGIGIFSILAFSYLPGGGRSYLGTQNLDPAALGALDFLLAPLGTLCGVLGSQILALRVQRQTLEGLAPPEILIRTRPRVGKTLWWAFGLASAITAIFFLILFLGLTGVPPSWMEALPPK